MKRYELNKKRKDKGTGNRPEYAGRTFYATNMFPYIERKATDIYIISRPGDRLDSLAFEFYKDVTLWWILAQANNCGKGTLAIPGGKQLRIPMETGEIIEAYNEIQRNRRVI